MTCGSGELNRGPIGTSSSPREGNEYGSEAFPPSWLAMTFMPADKWTL